MNARIDKIELHHVDIPMPTALFPVWIPGYPQYRLYYTLLTVTTRDGVVGIATGPAFGRERQGLGEFVGQFLVGLDPCDLDAVRERLRQASSLGWRNSWMELAFWDIAAQMKGVPLHQLIVERVRAPVVRDAPDAVPVYASFRELRSPKVRAESFERLQRIGFRSAKISVLSQDEEQDIAQIESARRFAGEAFELCVHAHQVWSISLVEDVPRWDLARALRFSERAADLGYRWLQEPLQDEAWDELAELSRKSRIPIAGGDMIPTFRLLKVVAGLGCYSIYTPDVVFAGISSVVSTLELCLQKGCSYSPSSNTDGIGLAANCHALAAWARLSASADACRLEFPWEPPAMIPDNRDTLIQEPLHVRSDGKLAVPTRPGLGVRIDPSALHRYAEPFFATSPVRFAVSSARRAGIRPTVEFAHRERRRSTDGA